MTRLLVAMLACGDVAEFSGAAQFGNGESGLSRHSLLEKKAPPPPLI